MTTLDAVTGAFSYTGRFVAPRLLAGGRTVRTLTNHPNRQSPLAGQIEALPLDFEHPARLVEALRGVDTLYNTYWVRSNHGAATFAAAVRNTGVLIDAAREAGVRRLVHVSIANPDRSDHPYYRGKAQLEQRVMGSGLSYAIVRPTLLFGHGDVLINNIAWFIRHLPVFAIPGNGQYRLQPVFVEDYADRIVAAGAAGENLTIDAAGPETFTFEGLIQMLRDAIGRRTVLIHVRPKLALMGAQLVSLGLRDITLTGNELRDLMDELLISHEPSTCPTRLSVWAGEHQGELGQRYASELERHYRSRNAQNAALGLGCVVSALVLASGIIWYPLIVLAIQDTLAMLFALAVGFWLGARWPARLALGLGNAAVIAGFAGIWILFRVAASDTVSPILFLGVALMIALGYALIGGSLARVLVARGLRRA